MYFFSPAADRIDREAFVGAKHPDRVNSLHLVNKVPFKFLTTLVHLTGAGGLFATSLWWGGNKTGKRSKQGPMTQLRISLFWEIQLKIVHRLILGLHEEKSDFWPLLI